MIWHIVRFDCSALDAATRDELRGQLADLERLDCVAWLQVGADLAEPHVLGLVSAFEDEDALETYRVHPDHVPVVERVKELAIPVQRFDIEADRGPDS